MIRYRQLGEILDARRPDADYAVVTGRVGHRVDRINYEVKDNLELDANRRQWGVQSARSD
jgi:hypothetical protein